MLTNPKAIFYCGTNGAGKSTLRSLKRDVVQIVIDSDHIAMELNPENPRLADLEAGRKAIELFKFATSQQIAFSMESTLSGKSILQRMEKAKEKGFYTILNYVGLSKPELNISRVRDRVRAGGHFIDEATIRKRYQVSRANLIDAILLSEESYIYDNSTESPKLMFRVKKSEKVIQKTAFLANWGNSVLDDLRQIGFQIQSEYSTE